MSVFDPVVVRWNIRLVIPANKREEFDADWDKTVSITKSRRS